jgi:hypothetical protein
MEFMKTGVSCWHIERIYHDGGITYTTNHGINTKLKRAKLKECDILYYYVDVMKMTSGCSAM